ncbi:MAG: AraC family transcriptional regulator [Solirubrobacterales bacterium]
MNLYVSLVNDAIEFIESNIHKHISLEDLGNYLCVSKFHFNRMFKTVSGITLKQYILGRKLTLALQYICENEISVIDCALEFGFEYPEVFSRAFKKQFGISPSQCRNTEINKGLVNKACLVERDIVNFRGSLTLNGHCIYLNELNLEGVFLEVDASSSNFKSSLNNAGERFINESMICSWLEHENLYAAVCCHGKDNGEYTVYYGKIINKTNPTSIFQKNTVPKGWYAEFMYQGDIFNISEAFIDDLYRWIIVKEVHLNQNGIGMLNIFGKDYENTGLVKVLVPVKDPF